MRDNALLHMRNYSPKGKERCVMTACSFWRCINIESTMLSIYWFFLISHSFWMCYCEDGGKGLLVRVVAEYGPPSSFTFEPPSYRAASALTLSCQVEGDHSGLLYEWTSTCSGNCFTQGRVTKKVSTPYLHSYDNGVHACMVYDTEGCTGNASITINVVGAGIYVPTGDKVLANNSVIPASSRNTVPSFRCLSGSSKSKVGNLIGPDGTDITSSTIDPFFVSHGGSYDPGTLLVRSVRPLESEDSGIYTYRTPDENGDFMEFHFGVYPSSTIRAPYCPTIVYTHSGDSIHTLSCVSYDSPPTLVIWERDGERICDNNTCDVIYQSIQKLLNRTTSAYNNTLTINATIEDVIGEYSCTIINSVGSSDTLTKAIRALEVTGHETHVLVKTSRSINCSTHLEVTRMEWVVVAVGNAVEVDEDGGQSLVFPIKPNSTGLDGAEFMCRITTARGKTFSETISIKVKEVTHEVNISGTANPLFAGEKYSLICKVISDVPPSVSWHGPGDGRDGSGDAKDGTMGKIEPVTLGNTTTLVLYFDPIKTSHGGTYVCISVIPHLGLKKDTRHIKVQLSTDDVKIVRSPSSAIVYTARPLSLICVTRLNRAVDTTVRVTHQWTGPRGVVSSSSGVMVSAVTQLGREHRSSVTFASLHSSHSGTYTCSSTVHAQPSSVFIEQSATESCSTSFKAAIQVSIEITYNSPDTYPTYSPPNYRTASSVSLKCVATGTTGSVTYRWTSTCRSDCFAYHSSSQTISEPFLRVRDAGVHTCRVTDGAGNSGMENTTMNIIGAGIYVAYAASSSAKVIKGVQGPQPANGYAIVDRVRGGYYYYTNTRLQLYCCSNVTTESGLFILPSGLNFTSSYGDAIINRHSGGHAYVGCIQLSFRYRNSYSYTLSNPYRGIYTCVISDSQGKERDVNIGLYNDGFSTKPTVSRLEYERSGNGSINLVCNIKDSPPSSIRWYRDGTPVNFDGDTTDLKVKVTNRGSSNFQVSLSICNHAGNVAGNYTCEVGNRFGNDSISHELEGLRISCTGSGVFMVGEVVRCLCISDVGMEEVQWYREDAALDIGLNSLTIPVTTGNHGEMHTCVISGKCGQQEDNFTIAAAVPDNWASVEISNTTGQNALHNTDYTLTCTVTAISGMHLAPSVEWVGPDGDVVVSRGNITVGEVGTQGTISTLTLSFSPVLTSNGGRYVCRAAISVPWMDSQPPQHSSTVNMPVITKAMFQLKMYPLPHCSTWDVDKALDLEQSIKRDVEKGIRERCDCDFSSTAIHSGEFSCQYTSCKSNSCELAAYVIYRAILNGSSELLSANQLMAHLQDWHEKKGSLLYNVFRLKLANSTECNIKIDSFDEEEC